MKRRNTIKVRTEVSSGKEIYIERSVKNESVIQI